MCNAETLLTIDCHAPLSMEFSQQEYWSGLPCSPPGDLLDPRIEPATSALAGKFFTISAMWETEFSLYHPYLYSCHLKYVSLAWLIFSSVAQSCSTLLYCMDCSMPGFPAGHQLPELDQTHVHQVSDAIQPSHPLLSPSPSVFNLFQHQGLFQWVSSSHQAAKVL